MTLTRLSNSNIVTGRLSARRDTPAKHGRESCYHIAIILLSYCYHTFIGHIFEKRLILCVAQNIVPSILVMTQGRDTDENSIYIANEGQALGEAARDL